MRLGPKNRLFLLYPTGAKCVDESGYVMMTFDLAEGQQWKKRVWPRSDHPRKLTRWNTVEVSGRKRRRKRRVCLGPSTQGRGVEVQETAFRGLSSLRASDLKASCAGLLLKIELLHPYR